MFCPLCRTKYRAGLTYCSDCGVDLVDVLPENEPRGYVGRDKGTLVQLWSGDDLALHSALLEDLQSARIPFFNRPAGRYSGSRSALDRTTPTAKFGFEVQVFSSDLASARSVLAKLTDELT